MLYFIGGYVLAVLFPIYKLNALIVAFWTYVGARLTGAVPAPVAPTAPVPPSPGLVLPVVTPPPSSQHVRPPAERGPHF